jgi:hypothetical protein
LTFQGLITGEFQLAARREAPGKSAGVLFEAHDVGKSFERKVVRGRFEIDGFRYLVVEFDDAAQRDDPRSIADLIVAKILDPKRDYGQWQYREPGTPRRIARALERVQSREPLRT